MRRLRGLRKCLSRGISGHCCKTRGDRQMIARWRRAVQASTLVLLALIPFLNKKGITFVSGSLYSLAIGPVWITDPLIGVQTVLTATRLDLALLLSMVIPVVQIGRASCRERV